MTEAPPPCEACGHPQRASRREVEWTHSFNLHDEIRALEAERDGLKHLLAEAVECLKAIDPLLLNDPDFQDLRRRAERALGGGK